MAAPRQSQKRPAQTRNRPVGVSPGYHRREVFIQESLRVARSLPLPEARLYLGGMLEFMDVVPEADPIRSAFVLLDQSDRQLEELLTFPRRIADQAEVSAALQ